ncbi:hypothetical protein ACFV27_36860 [Streptomyces antimycoticus]|uniref:hypothetical protein n=1 Tax=Streptomyces antimycoticus TaxID=68175 RepID=UPI0036B093F9
MPTSKHRRNGKKRPTRARPTTSSRMRKNRAYDQPCPRDLLVEEFGDEGAQWLTEEYERPLNLADLELEKAIRRGTLVMDHPERGVVEYTVAQVSRALQLTTKVTLGLALREGLVTQQQVDEVDCGEVNHEEDGPDILRADHWSEGLFLNERGLWNFGAGE